MWTICSACAERWSAGLLIVLACSVSACASDPVGSVADTYGYSKAEGIELPPIVIVYGFLGSVLEDQSSGHVVWGRFLAGEQRTFLPEIQRRLALPMSGRGEDDSLSDFSDDVVATQVMRNAKVKLGPVDVTANAYPGVAVAILTGIATPSESNTPSSRQLRKQSRRMAEDDQDTATVLAVAYDWRRDVTEATKQLEAAIERAHQRRLDMGLRGDAARVDIISHSLGSVLTRYYLRYGTQPLPDDGSPPVLDWRGAEKVGRVILVGPPNAGSLEGLVSLMRGGKPHSLMPKTPAAVIGTFVSMYQLMPHADQQAVVSAADGKPIDTFDVETWSRLGWGPLGRDDHTQKILKNLMPELESADARRAAAHRYVNLCLKNAQQFHAALDVPSSPPAGTSLHLFANDRLPTENVAVVDPETGKIVRIEEAWGDGTVTRESALRAWRTADWTGERLETSVDWGSVHFVDGDHFKMVKDPGLINNALYLLLQAPITRPGEEAGP